MNLKLDDMNKFKELIENEDPILKDVFKGHDYRDGTNNCQ